MVVRCDDRVECAVPRPPPASAHVLTSRAQPDVATAEDVSRAPLTSSAASESLALPRRQLLAPSSGQDWALQGPRLFLERCVDRQCVAPFTPTAIATYAGSSESLRLGAVSCPHSGSVRAGMHLDVARRQETGMGSAEAVNGPEGFWSAAPDVLDELRQSPVVDRDEEQGHGALRSLAGVPGCRPASLVERPCEG